MKEFLLESAIPELKKHFYSCEMLAKEISDFCASVHHCVVGLPAPCQVHNEMVADRLYSCVGECCHYRQAILAYAIQTAETLVSDSLVHRNINILVELKRKFTTFRKDLEGTRQDINRYANLFDSMDPAFLFGVYKKTFIEAVSRDNYELEKILYILFNVERMLESLINELRAMEEWYE